jgi:hypothetical protein
LLTVLISSIVLVIMSGPVSAQDKNSVDPEPLPALATAVSSSSEFKF